MSYKTERYKNRERFNEQYREIYRFLLGAGKLEYNEHFHWGRFEWMHRHSCLDQEKLDSIVIFRDQNEKIVGLLTYDTSYDDRTYLIHSSRDKVLLRTMVDAVLEADGNGAVIKVNAKDEALCQVLREKRFVKKNKDCTVLELDLGRDLKYSIPAGYAISEPGFLPDEWKYQMVIHRGFDHEDIPERWAAEVLKLSPNENPDLKVFVLKGDDYCAHCGLWHTEGETAYVEPVVTVPEHRKMGLARAVIYEAAQRAKDLGAKRAVVLSDQDFYYRIGFEVSSEVYCWEKIQTFCNLCLTKSKVSGKISQSRARAARRK